MHLFSHFYLQNLLTVSFRLQNTSNPIRRIHHLTPAGSEILAQYMIRNYSIDFCVPFLYIPLVFNYVQGYQMWCGVHFKRVTWAFSWHIYIKIKYFPFLNRKENICLGHRWCEESFKMWYSQMCSQTMRTVTTVTQFSFYFSKWMMK